MELTNEAKQNKNEVISFLSRVEVSVSDFSSPPLAWIAVGDDHNSGRISNLLSPCISRSREIRHFVGNEPKNKTPRPNTVPPPPLQGLLFLFPLFPDLSEFVLVFKKSKILLALAFSYSLIQTSTFDVIAHLLYTTFVTSASKQMTQSQSRGPQTRIYSVRLREKSKSSEICFCWLFWWYEQTRQLPVRSTDHTKRPTQEFIISHDVRIIIILEREGGGVAVVYREKEKFLTGEERAPAKTKANNWKRSAWVRDKWRRSWLFGSQQRHHHCTTKHAVGSLLPQGPS